MAAASYIRNQRRVPTMQTPDPACTAHVTAPDTACLEALAKLVDTGTDSNIDAPVVEFAIETFATAMLRADFPIGQVLFHRMAADPRYSTSTVSWAASTNGTMFEGRRAELPIESEEVSGDHFPIIVGYDNHGGSTKVTCEKLRVGFSCAARCEAVLELVSFPPRLFGNGDLARVYHLLQNFDEVFRRVLVQRIS